MQMLRALLIALCCVCAFFMCMGCAVRVYHVPDSMDVNVSSYFSFTLSPDNRWLVYFERVPVEAQQQLHYNYGLLRVRDLELDRLHRFELGNEEAPGRVILPTAAWTGDRFACVLPPPPQQTRSVLIDVRDPHEVNVMTGQVIQKHPDRYAFVSAEREIELPSRLTCSDCPDEEVTAEWIRQHVPEAHRPTHRHPAGASFDQEHVFYQRVEEINEVERITIVMRNIETGEERDLTTHRAKPLRLMPYVSASRFAPSPDGRWLAYRVLASADMGSDRGRLHLVNLETGRHRMITGPVFYDMRWTSDSSRLYFYHDNRLNYVEVE